MVKAGDKVRVVDNLSKPESKVGKDYEFLNLDLTDQKNALRAMDGVDICINMAAKIGGIGYFHKYPATILSENNKIYSATFEAAVKAKIKRMVYISSSMVFESAVKFPSKESDLTKIPPPVSAYGFSKLSGEWYCRAFWDQFKLPYSICRPFNAYGVNEAPGDEVGYAHVIPDLVKKCLWGQYPLELLGDGMQSRCFTYVEDLAEGIIKVAKHPKAVNEDFNIAHPKEIKMLDLAQMIWKIIRPEEEFKVKYVKGFTYDIKRRVPRVSKAKEILGWEAKTSLDQGLPKVIAWIRERNNYGKN